MNDSRPHDLLSGLKDCSPRVVKDLAAITTRAYGVATARWRPHPDFLLVGTKRGGTTSLWNYLAGHPQVLPMFPAPRGLKSNAYFFSGQGYGDAWYRSHFHSRAYRRWAARRVGPVVTGEASPYYMYGPHLPARIAGVMPQVKLIVLLRDPVDRAYGHHQERRKEGVEPLSFEDALAAEDARLAGEHERMAADPTYYSVAHDFYAYRDRGVYLPQLERIYAAFPRQQVLVLRSEDLYTDTQGAFDRTCRFLGIGSVDLGCAERHNFIPRAPLAPATRRALQAFYAPHNHALYQALGTDFGWGAEERDPSATVDA